MYPKGSTAVGQQLLSGTPIQTTTIGLYAVPRIIETESPSVNTPGAFTNYGKF